MKCLRCGSENINVQIITDTKLKNKHHSFLYWLIIGWWLHLLLWFFLTVPMILGKIFGNKRQKIVQTHKSVAICQNCGHRWNV